MEKVEGRMWKREGEWRRLKGKGERGMEKVEERRWKREEEWRRGRGKRNGEG